jgi:hypothetical protein
MRLLICDDEELIRDLIKDYADIRTGHEDEAFTVIQTNLDITSITNAEIDTVVAA